MDIARRRWGSWLVATTLVLLAAAAFGGAPDRASAQVTGVALESSKPSSGAVTPGPVIQIELTFNTPVEPVEHGVVLIGPGGSVVLELGPRNPPVAGPTSEATTWQAMLDGPLAPGGYAMNWSVFADGNLTSGSFGFLVNPTVAEAVVPVPQRPGRGTSPGSVADQREEPTEEQPEGEVLPQSLSRREVSDLAHPHPAAIEPTATANDAITTTQWLHTLLRFSVLASSLTAAGLALFAHSANAAAGARLVHPEMKVLGLWVRAGGLAAVAASGVEVVWCRANTAGTAMVVVGAAMLVTSVRASEVARLPVPAPVGALNNEPERFAVDRTFHLAPFGLWGGALVVAGAALTSFSPTGEGLMRWLLSTGHLAGTAVIAGGGFGLGLIAWQRRGDRLGDGMSGLVAKASTQWAGALSALLVTGAALTLFDDRLDSWSINDSTGRLLLAKFAAGVALLAVALRAHRAIEGLDRREDDRQISAELVRVTSIGFALVASSMLAAAAFVTI